VPELVSDLADAEACIVEPGGDGLAEDMTAHPRVADPIQSPAQVALGVGRAGDHPAGGRKEHASDYHPAGVDAPLELGEQVLRQNKDVFGPSFCPRGRPAPTCSLRTCSPGGATSAA
jgi:hypothetical protein